MDKVKKGVPPQAGSGLRPSGVEPQEASQAEPLVPNAGKLWFAAAIASKPGDLRLQTAWGNVSRDSTMGFIVAECLKKMPQHAILHCEVVEVDVEKREFSRLVRQRFGDAVVGTALLWMLSLSVWFLAASAMSTGTAKTPQAVEGQSPASAVRDSADAPKVQP